MPHVIINPDRPWATKLDQIYRQIAHKISLLSPKIKEPAQKCLAFLACIQMGFFFGFGGVLRAFDHLREIAAIDHHFSQHIDHGHFNRENISAVANQVLIGIGGFIDILFDAFNLAGYLKKYFSDVPKSVYEKYLIFQLESIQKKQDELKDEMMSKSKKTENDEALRHHQQARLMHYWHNLEEQKNQIIQELRACTEQYQKREKRLNGLLALLWGFLFTRSLLVNTPWFLVAYLGNVVFLPAFFLSMAFKGVCFMLERYRVKKELESCRKVEEKLQGQLWALSDSHEAVYASKDLVSRLLLEHARVQDERHLLELELKQNTFNAKLFFIGAGAVGLANLAGLCVDPLAAAVIATIVFIAIGLYVIPLIKSMRETKAAERECLTNMAALRKKPSKTCGEFDRGLDALEFKSSMHQLEHIQTLTWKGNHFTYAHKQKLLDRLEAILKKGCCSLEIAFHDKVDKFSEYYDSVLKHLTNRKDEFFNQKDLKVLDQDIKKMTSLVVDIRTMQDLCPLLKKATNPYHPITPFLKALLNSLTLTTFYKDATAVVDLRASLGYFSDQYHKVNGQNLRLYQNYKRIQKRTQHAHTKLPFWSIFSAETREDRAMLHMTPQGV